MKRMQILLLVLALALALAACGGKPSEDDAGADAAQSGDTSGGSVPTPKAGSDLVFSYKDCPLPMNAEFAPLLEYLGEPDKYFEAASCAFDGLDKTYTYGGVEIITYPNEDKDYVSSIRLLDNSASTPEGITIGSTPEEVTAAFGEDYEERGDQYVYENGDATLTVLFEDGAAISVEYMAINDLLG